MRRDAMSERRLLHYTGADEALDIKDCAQTKPCGLGDKPNGFWVSVEGSHDWLTWCLAHSYRLDALRNCWQVTLRDDANVIFINDEGDMENFHHEFSMFNSDYRMHYIDWPRVARDHDGILITQFFPHLALEEPYYGWYYGWNCSSGCIWRASAINNVRRIDE